MLFRKNLYTASYCLTASVASSCGPPASHLKKNVAGFAKVPAPQRLQIMGPKHARVQAMPHVEQ